MGRWIRQLLCSARGHCGCPTKRIRYIGPMTIHSYGDVMAATMPTRVRISRECCRCGKESK